MKPGDLVKFIRGEVKIGGQGSTYLRDDCIGIVIKKVRHLDDMWIVNFPRLGGLKGYPSCWLEVLSEV